MQRIAQASNKDAGTQFKTETIKGADICSREPNKWKKENGDK